MKFNPFIGMQNQSIFQNSQGGKRFDLGRCDTS